MGNDETHITTQIAENSQIKRGEKGYFIKGHVPKSPGRPKETKEQKLVRKAVKQYVKEYEQGIAEALPEISPVLIKLAKQGSIKAIREVHEVVGAHKPVGNNTIVPIQINFGEEKEAYA